jgi:hypothetical protein
MGLAESGGHRFELAFAGKLQRGIAGFGKASAAAHPAKFFDHARVAVDGARGEADRAGRGQRGDEAALKQLIEAGGAGDGRDRVEV